MTAPIGAVAPTSTLRLKNGSPLADPRADYIGETDLRNAAYPVATLLPGADSSPRMRSYTWRVAQVLDQRSNGACVGFAWAHELIARPLEVAGITESFATKRVYHAAQIIDRWPGGEYPGARPLMAGTSVLAGARAIKALGYISQYRWAQSVTDLASAVGFLGPAVLGTRLYSGMRDPDDAGFMHPEGTRLGGHALLVTGVRIRPLGAEQPDPDLSNFLIQNSWGPQWGKGGTARITFNDMAELVPNAEVCIPVKRSQPIP